MTAYAPGCCTPLELGDFGVEPVSLAHHCLVHGLKGAEMKSLLIRPS